MLIVLGGCLVLICFSGGLWVRNCIKYITYERECTRSILVKQLAYFKLDVYGSVHHNTNLIEMTNKMQLCRAIYYSIVS